MDNDNISLFKAILSVLKKRLKLRNLLLLALLLSFNSFAWFIYTNRIASGIDVHVKSWNISFEFDNQQMEEMVDFTVDELFPGMDDYYDEVKIKNVGEADAKLSYSVESITIFGEVFQVGVDEVTNDSLILSLANDYPFSIVIGTTNEIVSSGGGEESFYISVIWLYESGDDEADTVWGNRAYDFYKDNPDDSPIVINLKISALQVENTSEGDDNTSSVDVTGNDEILE